jgi:hypothetical protein
MKPIYKDPLYKNIIKSNCLKSLAIVIKFTTRALTLIALFFELYNFFKISTPSCKIPVALSFLEAE